MSIRLMSGVFFLSLPPSEKLVLLALADAANDDDGGCFFLMATIARKVSMDARSVRRVLRRLVSLDLLRVEYRQGRSSLFFVNVSRVSELSTTPDRGSSPTPDRMSSPPDCRSSPPDRRSSPPDRMSSISVSYPGPDPLTNPLSGNAKNSHLRGGAGPESAPRSEGLARGKGSEPEYSPEVRRENIRRLRESFRSQLGIRLGG